MSLSRIVAIGNGLVNQFAVNFALGYIKIADVTCQVNNELDGFGDPVYRTITVITPGLLQISGAIPGVGVDVVFTRTVSADTLLVDWEDSAVMNDDNLNLAQKQLIMLVHQVIDGRFEAFTTNLDMGGFQIKNLADPTLPQDAVTINWIQDFVTDVTGGAVVSVNGLGGVVILTKTDLGLGNIDNTSDVNKPVSTAQAASIATKAALVHTHVLADVTNMSADGRAFAALALKAQQALMTSNIENPEYGTQGRILAALNFI
jgi:hypothetical protein